MKIFFVVLLSAITLYSNTLMSSEDQLILGLLMVDRSKRIMSIEERNRSVQSLLQTTGYSYLEADKLLLSFKSDPRGWFKRIGIIEELLKEAE